MRMRPVSERTRLSVPRYRVEERQRDLAAFIAGFADTDLQYEALVAVRAAQLTRARVHAGGRASACPAMIRAWSAA